MIPTQVRVSYDICQVYSDETYIELPYNTLQIIISNMDKKRKYIEEDTNAKKRRITSQLSIVCLTTDIWKNIIQYLNIMNIFIVMRSCRQYYDMITSSVLTDLWWKAKYKELSGLGMESNICKDRPIIFQCVKYAIQQMRTVKKRYAKYKSWVDCVTLRNSPDLFELLVYTDKYKNIIKNIIIAISKKAAVKEYTFLKNIKEQDLLFVNDKKECQIITEILNKNDVVPTNWKRCMDIDIYRGIDKLPYRNIIADYIFTKQNLIKFAYDHKFDVDMWVEGKY